MFSRGSALCCVSSAPSECQLDAGTEYRHPADPQWRPEWTDEGRLLIQIQIAHLFSTHRAQQQTFDNSEAIERYSWHLVRDWSDPEATMARTDPGLPAQARFSPRTPAPQSPAGLPSL